MTRAVNRYFENPIPSPPVLRSSEKPRRRKEVVMEMSCSCEGEDAKGLENRCAACVSEILGEAFSFLEPFRRPLLIERKHRKKTKVSPARSTTKKRMRSRRRLLKRVNRVTKRKREAVPSRPRKRIKDVEVVDDEEEDSDDDIPLAELYKKVNGISNDGTFRTTTKTSRTTTSSRTTTKLQRKEGYVLPSSSSSSDEEGMPLAALYYRKTGKNIKLKGAPKSKQNTTLPSESKENTTVPSKSKNPPSSSSSSSSSSSDEEGESMSLAEIARQRGLQFSRSAKRRKHLRRRRRRKNQIVPRQLMRRIHRRIACMLCYSKQRRCDADYRLAPTEITSTKTKSSSSSSKRATTSNQPSERSNMTKFVWSVEPNTKQC